MKKILLTALISSVALGSAFAQRDAKKIVPNEHLSLKQEIERAYSKGVKHLLSKQQENGMWGEKEFPALTALPTTALLLDPRREVGSEVSKEARSGLEYLVKQVKLDGGIYGKGLGSYNTSLSMMGVARLRG